MGVEYILSKAINIPDQFPFWSSVLMPDVSSVAVAASATGTITITPTATWMIMGGAGFEGASIAGGWLSGKLLIYDSTAAAYQLAQTWYTDNGSGSAVAYFGGGAGSFSVICDANTSIEIQIYNSAGYASNIYCHTSGYVLGTRKLRLKSIQKRKKTFANTKKAQKIKEAIKIIKSNINLKIRNADGVYIVYDEGILSVDPDNIPIKTYKKMIDVNTFVTTWEKHISDSQSGWDEVAECLCKKKSSFKDKMAAIKKELINKNLLTSQEVTK